MAKKTVTITAVISLAWWLKIYIHLLIGFCLLLQREPDAEKFEKIIAAGTRIRFTKAPAKGALEA